MTGMSMVTMHIFFTKFLIPNLFLHCWYLYILSIPVCEQAYGMAQNLDPNSEGRGVLQFKTGLMSVIKVLLCKLWILCGFLSELELCLCWIHPSILLVFSMIIGSLFGFRLMLLLYGGTSYVYHFLVYDLAQISLLFPIIVFIGVLNPYLPL